MSETVNVVEDLDLKSSSALELDTHIVALLRQALRGNESDLLELQDREAQRALDALHHVSAPSSFEQQLKLINKIQILDTSSFSIFDGTDTQRRVQHRLRRILLKLALRCRSVPSQLILRDGQWSSLVDRGGGSFADIYEGEYKGKRVAVKRLRLFQVTDDTARAGLVSVSLTTIPPFSQDDY